MTKNIAVTVAQNDAPFLVDWVTYHLALGFQDFRIYAFESGDGTAKVARNLERLGYAKFPTIDLNGMSPRDAALNAASTDDDVQTADWVYFGTPDEFLSVSLGAGVFQDLTEHLGNASQGSAFSRTICAPKGLGAALTDFKASSDNQHHDTVPTAHLAHGITELRTQEVTQMDAGVARIHSLMMRLPGRFWTNHKNNRFGFETDAAATSFWHLHSHACSQDAAFEKTAGLAQKFKAHLMQDRRLKKLQRSALDWHKRREEALLGSTPEVRALVQKA